MSARRPAAVSMRTKIRHATQFSCKGRERSDDEAAVDLELLPVDGDAAAAAQIADHVPVDGGVVAPACLGIRHADREMDRAADLLVEQAHLREAIDSVIGADTELAEPARAFVGVERLDQELLVSVGARV